MNIPLTQSEAWAKLQTDLGKSATYKHTRDFTFLAIDESTPVGHYLYLPYGPVYASPKGFQKALGALQDLVREKSAIFIRIEPQDSKFPSYAPQNAKKSHDLNPKETWVLDLTGNDADLKAKLPSRLLRYYRSAAKKGITIETTRDPQQIGELLSLQRTLATEKNINVYSEHYLATELAQPFATLYLVKQAHDSAPTSASESIPTPNCIPPAKTPKSVPTPNSTPSAKTPASSPSGAKPTNNTPEILAAGLVFDDGTTRYNLQGAQSEQGRRLHATGILTIQLILDAQAKGLKTFDFWGIAPENASENHPWAGFTAFKKTFAGRAVDYAGTYDLVLDPTKYHLYQLLRRANRLRRKIKI